VNQLDSTEVIHKLMDELYERKSGFGCLSVGAREKAYMEMRRAYYGHPAVEEWFNKKREELISQ